MKDKNIIILAAGKGTRLKEYTKSTPKGMVELKNKPILYWHLSNIKEACDSEVILVCGYEKEKLKVLNKKLVENPEYETTNMIASLWCARDYFDSGFIMAYSDIIYNPDVLTKLLASDCDISVVVDRAWLPYWQKRVENVLDDAESLSLGKDGLITSIGQKVDNASDIEGQYIGLVSFSCKGVELLEGIIEKEIIANENGKSYICYGKKFGDLYVTDVLQGLINSGAKISPVWINGGWVEIDTVSDLELAESISEKLTSDSVVINR